MLANAGYDVWIANGRGNQYSFKHIKLDIDKDKKEYFNYTFRDIGLSDIPAMIDMILKKTEKKMLTYIGHS